jgi:hypothetical protein
MPDTKVEAAIEEVKAVLQKHDLAGVVFVASPTNVEYLYHLDPSWTCLRILPDGGIGARAKREDFPNLEAQKECVRVSVSIVAGFADMGRLMNERFMQLLLALGKKFKISIVNVDEG